MSKTSIQGTIKFCRELEGNLEFKNKGYHLRITEREMQVDIFVNEHLRVPKYHILKGYRANEKGELQTGQYKFLFELMQQNQFDWMRERFEATR